MTPNPGRQPERSRGKQCLFVWASGIPAKQPYACDTAFWGRRWGREDYPFDIKLFEVVE